MPPPLPVAVRPRKPRTALTLSLVWPGLGQFYNRQLGLGTIVLVGNTGLYLLAIPWGRLGRIYSATQEQATAIVEGGIAPERAIDLLLKTASAPLPANTALLVSLALIGALTAHAGVAWQAWLYAKSETRRHRPPALPMGGG